MLKKLIKCLVSTSMVLSMAMVTVAADEENSAAEAFMADLAEDGYAELDAWKVEKVAGKDNVYHMDEETKELPGGANDAEGNMNNPSSIYFVVEDDTVLIIDGGNPTADGSTKQEAAKTIVEAMTAGKDTYFAFTHNHGDHVGLIYNSAVVENINIKGVYVGAEDNSGMLGEAIAKYDITLVGEDSSKGEVATFTVGSRTYDVVDVHAHTAGSVVFVDTANEILFSGDSIGSGFVWLLWNTVPNPIGNLTTAVTKLQKYVGDMTSPKILAGHRWQQFWENNSQRPGEMTIQYLNDMNAVAKGLTDGTAKKSEYTPGGEGALEISADGCKAKIDTKPEIIQAYLDGVNSYTGAENVWVFSAAETLSIETINNTQASKFMVFADKQLTKEEAKALIDGMGITDIINYSASQAVVIGPQGADYTEADVEIAMDVMGSKVGPSASLKLVGIGKGATFVNKYMSQKDWGVSGIFTYGGEAGVAPKYAVPAYVSNSPEAVAKDYIAANKAEKTAEEGTITTYVNPNSRFEVTVVNTGEEDVNAAFQNAWKTVLSKFGRIGNISTDPAVVGTWYSKPNTVEREFMLVDSVDCCYDQFERTIELRDFDNDGIDSLYYVYVPKTLKDAKAGTLPVVFLMHGNTNDPRTQFDTSGWAQVALKEGIVLVCPEWQGHTYQGYTYDPMTADTNFTPNSDFVTCVKTVLADYPAIDASRVYISGLSAGCRNTSNNLLVNTGIFAAGAGQSGPFKNAEAQLAQLQAGVDANKDKYDIPMIYFAGDRDEYLRDWDQVTGSGGEQFAKLFAEMNEVEIETGVEAYSKLYGVKWDSYTEDLANEGTCTIYSGVFENAKGVEICMNRVLNWGHWNYQPDAQIMWQFMSKYARNQETGEIVRLDKVTPEQPTTPENPEEGGTTGGTTTPTTPTTPTKPGATPNVGIYNNAAYVAVAGLALAGAAYVAFKKKEN